MPETTGPAPRDLPPLPKATDPPLFPKPLIVVTLIAVAVVSLPVLYLLVFFIIPGGWG